MRMKPDGEGQQRGERRADQDEPFTPSEGEFLVAAFGGEELHRCVSPCGVGSTRLTRMWSAPTGSPAARRVALPARRPQGAGHVDLAGDALADRAGLAVDRGRPAARRTGASRRPRPRRPGTTPRVPRNDRISASVEPDTATSATSPGSRSYSSGVLGRSCASARGIGKPCGQVVGPVQGHVEPLGDLVGQVVLERHGQLVGLVPGVAEHVGEEALDDAVAPDGGDRGLAAVVGERHALVGPVVDQPAVGQPLDQGGDGAGRQARAGPRGCPCAPRSHPA